MIFALLLIGIQNQNFRGENSIRIERQEPTKTLRMIWDGVYTETQATNGAAIFKDKCDACHGDVIAGDAEFQGPPLKGEKFFENWREDHLGSLHMKIRSSMPLLQPSLTAPEYLVVLAYILKENGFPSGSIELEGNGLRTIWVEGKNGPKPLPSNSLIQTVGCMTRMGTEWILTNASRPIRNRDPDPEKKPPLEQLQLAATEPPGTFAFDLTNFFMLGDFDPASHEGKKMLARGALIRRSSGDRVSLTGLEIVGARCEQ